MKFFSYILVFLTLALTGSVTAQPAHKAEKKKRKHKSENKDKSTSLDAETTQRVERLFLDAERAKIIEDWETAIKDYREVLEIDGKNANAHFQLAQIFTGTAKLEEAEKEAAEAVKLDESNKWYLEMLASVYMNRGKTKEATELFKALCVKFPNNPNYFLNLAFLQSKTGQYEAAIKTFDQFEKNFGLDENVSIEKKNLYLRLNKFSEAANEIHKLVTEYPGETEYMLMEAELYRANRMKEKAIELYKKILAHEPDNAQALLALADLGMQGGNEQQSFDNIKKVFANDKVDVDTKIKILFPYLQYWDLQQNKHAQAFELAQILTATHPNQAKAFAIQGDLYYINASYDTALTSYLKSLDLNKDIFQVWQQVMLIYNQKKDWANTIKICTEAMELFPNQPVIYLFKGGAEMQSKENEKAVKSFLKGEKMSADNDKLRAQFFANLGDAYHNMDRYTESDSAYDRSLKYDSENSYVLNNYSYYLSLRKTKLEKAKQMSAYSNKLEPGNSSFLDTYAWILFQLNDFTGAKEWQEKALKAGGDKSGTILEHYGDILSRLGNTEEAIKYWKQAKEAGTDSATIDQKIAAGKYLE